MIKKRPVSSDAVIIAAHKDFVAAVSAMSLQVPTIIADNCDSVEGAVPRLQALQLLDLLLWEYLEEGDKGSSTVYTSNKGVTEVALVLY